jgi:hypothetical protein
MHWNDGIDASLCLMAVTYATHIYNNTKKGVSKIDILTGSKAPLHRLMEIHEWGCPVYILNPKVQCTQKLPPW